MAKNNKIQMPQSMGGLTRYFDDYKSKLEIKPQYVIAFIIAVVIIMIVLNVMGTA